MGNPIARFDPDAGQGGRFASGRAGIWKEPRFEQYAVKVGSAGRNASNKYLCYKMPSL